ncbi:hypothetical protein B0H34DRAFT_777686 [Crassisporium funariophilum]|nr:hypothetical protein B0H34DRAFT_777686 [Crassisporium funariophilum]
MIVDCNHHNMKQPLLGEASQDSPPSYDYATETESLLSSPPTGAKSISLKTDKPTQHLLIPEDISGPSYTTQPSYTPAPMVYNYMNPSSGERVVSLLPPDHPEMVCLQSGSHIPHTHYGLLGILAAVLWFPLGIGLCLLDRRVKCSRCGLLIDDGVCG